MPTTGAQTMTAGPSSQTLARGTTTAARKPMRSVGATKARNVNVPSIIDHLTSLPMLSIRGNILCPLLSPTLFSSSASSPSTPVPPPNSSTHHSIISPQPIQPPPLLSSVTSSYETPPMKPPTTSPSNPASTSPASSALPPMHILQHSRQVSAHHCPLLRRRRRV